MLNVDAALNLTARPIGLKRETEGHHDENGDWNEGVKGAESIQATVQPVTAKTLKDIPEGKRNDAQWAIWTKSEIGLDDIVSINDAEYLVIHVWTRAEGGFYKAIAGLLKG